MYLQTPEQLQRTHLKTRLKSAKDNPEKDYAYWKCIFWSEELELELFGHGDASSLNIPHCTLSLFVRHNVYLYTCALVIPVISQKVFGVSTYVLMSLFLYMIRLYTTDLSFWDS